ncbi:hypothetical protein TDB9533_02434 [Thalassocella blandensis]|nr:hypothetical protein TDB9533_02434 [Thalassocella blandensis]
MEFTLLFLVYPLMLLVIACYLVWKFFYLGAFLSALLATFYFYYFAARMNGFGNPTGAKNKISQFSQWRDAIAIGTAVGLLLCGITFIRSLS